MKSILLILFLSSTTLLAQPGNPSTPAPLNSYEWILLLSGFSLAASFIFKKYGSTGELENP